MSVVLEFGIQDLGLGDTCIIVRLWPTTRSMQVWTLDPEHALCGPPHRPAACRSSEPPTQLPGYVDYMSISHLGKCEPGVWGLGF